MLAGVIWVLRNWFGHDRYAKVRAQCATVAGRCGKSARYELVGYETCAVALGSLRCSVVAGIPNTRSKTTTLAVSAINTNAVP
jgi:hypothetical protein